MHECWVNSPQQPRPFIIIKGEGRGSGAGAAPVRRHESYLYSKRFVEFYCLPFVFCYVFKSKEDFRTCLLQTGAKVSLDLEMMCPFPAGATSFLLRPKSGGGARHSVSSPASTRPPFASSKKNSCTVILWKHFRGRNFASFISADPPPPGPPAAKAPLPPGGAVV